jgi:hypothetical protein
MRTGLVLLLVALMTVLGSRAASAQEIAGGGAAIFLTKDGDSQQIGDIFAEASWAANIGVTNRSLMISALAGYGEDGDGFVGIGGRHFWQVSDGIYPGLGAQLFYLNGGDLDALQETSVFVGPEVSLELLAEGYDLSVMPFVAFYPAIVGDDANIFRFGIRLNELPVEN